MGQGQSKDELLYQQVSYGNAEGIKTLHREGAGLEVVELCQNLRVLIAASLFYSFITLNLEILCKLLFIQNNSSKSNIRKIEFLKIF